MKRTRYTIQPEAREALVCRLTAELEKEPTVAFAYLHGSLLDSEGMVLTTQDYVRHYANDRISGDPVLENRVLTFLENLFKQKTVLFIGYGLEELEILEYVILKARRIRASDQIEAKHFLLQGFFSHEKDLMRSLKQYYLRECGIQLIPFLRDQRGWDQLLDVLAGDAGFGQGGEISLWSPPSRANLSWRHRPDPG